MDTKFWHEKWENNQIAFHASEANPFLVKYFGVLKLSKQRRVFLPLCGKTLDISFLLSLGYRIAGAELVEKAVRELFDQLCLKPSVTPYGSLKRYSAGSVDIFAGDIFQLTPEILGPVDAVYDRAALVALPQEMRSRYTSHLKTLAPKKPQFMITYEYDQSKMDGPPFSISEEEIRRHYQDVYRVMRFESADVVGGIRGCPATENVWLLKPSSL